MLCTRHLQVYPGRDQPGAAGQRPAGIAQARHHREREPAAGAVAADRDPAPARSPGKQETVTGQRIVEGSGERVFGCQPVAHRQGAHPGRTPGLRRHDPMAGDRARAIPAAMQGHQHAEFVAAGRERPFARHAAGIDGFEADVGAEAAASRPSHRAARGGRQIRRGAARTAAARGWHPSRCRPCRGFPARSAWPCRSAISCWTTPLSRSSRMRFCRLLSPGALATTGQRAAFMLLISAPSEMPGCSLRSWNSTSSMRLVASPEPAMRSASPGPMSAPGTMPEPTFGQSKSRAASDPADPHRGGRADAGDEGRAGVGACLVGPAHADVVGDIGNALVVERAGKARHPHAGTALKPVEDRPRDVVRLVFRHDRIAGEIGDRAGDAPAVVLVALRAICR